jgi:hypothetical protein
MALRQMAIDIMLRDMYAPVRPPKARQERVDDGTARTAHLQSSHPGSGSGCLQYNMATCMPHMCKFKMAAIHCTFSFLLTLFIIVQSSGQRRMICNVTWNIRSYWLQVCHTCVHSKWPPFIAHLCYREAGWRHTSSAPDKLHCVD